MDRGPADLTSDAEPLSFDGPDDTSYDRRHGRRALWLSIGLLILLIAGAAVVIVHFAKPKPGAVGAPTHVAGLTLDRQSNASDTAEYLRSAVAAGMNLDSSVGAVYTDGSGDAHSVIFVGGTTTAGSTSARLKSLFGLLDDGTDGVANVTHEQAGKLGGLVDCATTTEATADSNGSGTGTPEAMAACGWADGDTVGLALFPNRPISEAVGLFGQMRSTLETHN
jgi:hypothetical protein